MRRDYTEYENDYVKVIEYLGILKHSRRTWRCICKGCQREVIRRTSDINQLGFCKWCSHKKHGMFGSPEWNSRSSMKTRCLNSKSTDYNNYGGRGIKISGGWLEFDNFIKDMGRMPTKEHTIERINTDKDYCKENCKRATRKEQTRNRRNTKKYKGIPLGELCERKSIKYSTVLARLNKGRDIERSLNTKVKGT